MVLKAFPQIRAQAERASGSVAIRAPGRKPLTYGQLLNQVERMETALELCGIGPGEVVAMALPDGAEMVTAAIGVGLSRACAPLNPAFTAAEFESCLSSLAPAALMALAGHDSAATLAARTLGIPVLDVGTLPDEPAGAFAVSVRFGGRPQQCRNAADAAILLFTSATSGRPKLVPLSHSNLDAIFCNTTQALHLRAEDCLLSLMPLFHLQGLASVLGQLSVGGQVVCTSGFEAARFYSWLSDFRTTWYTAGPTLHHAILTALDRRSPPCPLHFVRSIGAPLLPDLLAAVERALGAPVLEGYGLTEAGLVSSNPLPPRRRRPGSVGVRLGTDIAICDPSGHPLPAGHEGEICICGPAVTAGYLSPVEANRMTFRDGWLRTGDIGRFDEEGYLTISGRLSDIINRGGEKVMPQEVDHALAAHPSVAEATSFAVPHATLGQDILAAVVLHPDAQATESALQDFAARRIARFKIPRRMLFLEHIPKGATGKPNRAALSERFSAATLKPETGTQGLVAQPVHYPASNSLTEPSRTRLERDLAAIWKEVLGIPEIGIHDDFFDLGGHSLMAAHMLARVEQAFGRKLTLDRLIHAPTIRSLAGLIGETEGDVEGSRIVPIQPEGSQPPFFMIRPLPIFRPLAHRLPHDRPFLGVALPEREQLPEQYALRDVARKLVQAVCRRQPSGPYYLAGWCADGVLAYEMAQQLEAQGKRVALLVLFDSPSPAYWKQISQWGSLSSKLQLLVWNARFQSASLRQLGKKEIPGYVMQRIKALFILAREKTFHLLRVSRQSVKGRRKDAWRPTGLRVRIGGYETRPIKGKLVLFRSSGWRLGASRDPSFGWGEIAGARLAIHRVPGDHLSIFLEPNVRQLAEKLACHLSEPPLVSPDSPISLTVMSHSRLVNDRRREPRRGAS